MILARAEMTGLIGAWNIKEAPPEESKIEEVLSLLLCYTVLC
jgi:hypothetical protein